MSFDLIYPAIIIFSLLMVGLVLTVMEFIKLNQVAEEKRLSELMKPPAPVQARAAKR